MACKDEQDSGAAWTAAAAGIVIGVAIGGVLGILFAPRSGEETRHELKDKAEQALDELREAAGELSERARDLAAKTKDNLNQSIEAGKDAYTRTREDLAARLDS